MSPHNKQHATQSWRVCYLPVVRCGREAQVVSVARPAHGLTRHKDVEHAEGQEVQEQDNGCRVVGGPVKDGGFDQQKGHCNHSGDNCSVQIWPAHTHTHT